MPKVGSQTIEATLRESGLPHEIFRIHFISRKRARIIQQKSEGCTDELRRQNHRWELDWASRLRPMVRARKWLRYICPEIPKIQVITGVREPIGCALSAVFENHSVNLPSLDAVRVADCRNALLQAKRLSFYLTWFDAELKLVIGLDVYRKPFPREPGYAIYEHHLARVLVYRFEALHLLPRMLKEFLGHDIPEVVNRNMSSRKEYAGCYQQIKQRLRLPANFVAAQCNSKMVKHFYSEEERQRLYDQWAESSPTAAESLTIEAA